MTDEIIRKGEGYVIYRTDELGPAVPYVSEIRAESTNHGFFDLRKQPELIDDVPEAQKSKGLLQILRTLNAPNSPFMSLGCECRFDEVSNSNGQLYFSSYTDFTFHEPQRHSSEQQMIEVAEQFLVALEPAQEALFSFEIGIQRMRHFFKEEGGYNITLGLFGYGKTEKQAKEFYEIGAIHTDKALAKIISDNLID